MERRDNGGPAFPSDMLIGANVARKPFEGMSMRDWFAGQALAGYVVDFPDRFDEAARGAYAYADAMLAERLK